MSIYDEIGGEPALTAVVDDLYVRILADPELSGFFVGTPLPRLKGRQVEFFAQVLGGPQIYSGQDMDTVHRGLGIEGRHFDLVAGHLIQSLLGAGVPQATVDEIIGAIAPLRDTIARAPSA